MAEPSISIIAPVYRTPLDLLRRFLHSALNQTIRDIDLIAVNDASPDDCPLILDEAASQDSRVTVVHRSQNGRAGMARNDGLALARGEYVLFADADDALQPDMCEKLLGLARKHDADIVACSWLLIDPEGGSLEQGSLPDSFFDLALMRQKVRAYRIMTFALWNKLFRREVIAPMGFEQFEANIGEDTLFNVTALCRSRKMVTTSYTGYGYTVHAASATGRSTKGMSYLRTLAQSGERVRQTLCEMDGSLIARRYADVISLRRFATGCGWIAENPDAEEQQRLWTYWRKYLREELLPRLESRHLLGGWYRVVTALGDARTAYRLTWAASRMLDVPAAVDRLRRRFRPLVCPPAAKGDR